LSLCCFISDLLIALLQSKLELYKEGYHQARKEIKQLKCEKKILKEENRWLQKLVEEHEEIFSLL